MDQFITAYKTAFTRYTDFSGRTSVGGFWRFVAISVAVSAGHQWRCVRGVGALEALHRPCHAPPAMLCARRNGCRCGRRLRLGLGLRLWLWL